MRSCSDNALSAKSQAPRCSGRVRSARRGGNRVRITAQLIDAVTGRHLWAERYERDMADVFAVQEEIAERVVVSIEPEIHRAEQQRALRARPEHLGA